MKAKVTIYNPVSCEQTHEYEDFAGSGVASRACEMGDYSVEIDCSVYYGDHNDIKQAKDIDDLIKQDLQSDNVLIIMSVVIGLIILGGYLFAPA